MTAVNYTKGPLGYSVQFEGKAAGTIRRVGASGSSGWLLKLNGYTFPATPGTVAHKFGSTVRTVTHYTRTIGEAKAFARYTLTGRTGTEM